jgi:thiol-disulfide isomerase/thioredoxin
MQIKPHFIKCLKARVGNILLAAALLAVPAKSPAQSATNVPPVRTELEVLVRSVQDDVATGKATEADLAPELRKFDELLAKQHGAKNEAAAQIALFKALLYIQVIEDTPKGSALIKQVEQDYPGTQVSRQAHQVLQTLAAEQSASKAASTLVAGAPCPDLTATNLNGQPVSLGQYKGRIVLIDFWASWCGSCREELPDVIGAYQKYHPQGLEIIGISLDSSRADVRQFLKQEPGMTWAEVVDGEGGVLSLSTRFGVESIPDNLLVGADGRIIGRDLHGPELTSAVAQAVEHHQP